MQNIHEGSFLQNGKYKIIKVIGHGGFGITYLAEHTLLSRHVAIKEFFPQQYCDRDVTSSDIQPKSQSSAQQMDLFASKFMKEAITLSRLSHPGIVSVLDVFKEHGTVYFVMDYIEGPDLRKMIEFGPMPEFQAVKYITKIGEALDYIHSQHVNHLDVKPSNILVRAENDEPVLIDFGLSKNYDANGSQTSTTPIGVSRGFAPIEQYTGSLEMFSPESDIYSLGATLYNLLTRVVPPEPTIILNSGGLQYPDNIKPSVRNVINRAMALSKSDRYHSVTDFLSDLKLAVSATDSAPVVPQQIIPPVPQPEPEPERVPQPVPEPEPAKALEPELPVAEPAAAPAEEIVEPALPPVPATTEPEPIDEPVNPVIPEFPAEPDSPEEPEQESVQEPAPEPEPLKVNFSSKRPSTPKKKNTADNGATTDKPSSGPKKFIIIGAVIAFVAAAVAAFFIFFNNRDSSSEQPTESKVDTSFFDEEDEEPTPTEINVSNMICTVSGASGSYTGMCTPDSIPNGSGKIEFTNSSYISYEGEFTNGEITGKGILKSKTGTLEGTFNDGMPQEGTLTINESGLYFTGTFKDNNPLRGTWYTADGKVYQQVN
ncbi:MAG: protein kinase [Bacteroides sp.]|nr:protein kinase [Bacteroides sp.]MCM1413888.1 protein kinase [Bacteroides sp.]